MNQTFLCNSTSNFVQTTFFFLNKSIFRIRGVNHKGKLFFLQRSEHGNYYNYLSVWECFKKFHRTFSQCMKVFQKVPQGFFHKLNKRRKQYISLNPKQWGKILGIQQRSSTTTCAWRGGDLEESCQVCPHSKAISP